MTSCLSLVSLLVFCIWPCAASSLTHAPTAVLDEKHFRDALARNPRDPAAHSQYGRWLAAQQRHLEAEVEARAAVNAVPSDPAFRAELAAVLAATDAARAEAEFTAGLERGENAELRSAYARFILTVRKDASRASAEWIRAASGAPTPILRGEMLLAAARAREASGGAAGALYAQAVEADRSPDALVAYAAFLRHVQLDYRLAEAAYNEALQLDMKHPNALLGYATFLQHVRMKHDEAEDLYIRAVADSNDSRSRHAYAQFLWRVRGDYERMGAVAGEAVALEPALMPAWERVLAWDKHRVTPHSVWECVERTDAADILACALLVLVDHWASLWQVEDSS